MRSPQVNDYYTNKRGQTFKVLWIDFNRVIFVPDNYRSIVNMSVKRFTKEYTYAGRA